MSLPRTRQITPAPANPAPACSPRTCRKGYVHTTTDVLPRLGIAYQLYPNTVIRAGGGRFVEYKGIIDNIFPGGNSPFQPTVSVSNVSVDNPGAALNSTVEPPHPDHYDEQPPGATNQVELERDPPAAASRAALVSYRSPMWGLAVCIIGMCSTSTRRQPVLSPIIQASTLTISGHIRVSPSFSKRKAG